VIRPGRVALRSVSLSPPAGDDVHCRRRLSRFYGVLMKRIAVLLAIALVLAACGSTGADSPSATSSTTPTSTTMLTSTTTLSTQATSLATTTSAPSTTSTKTTSTSAPEEPPPEPLEGWGRIPLNGDVFGGITLTAGAAADGRYVLVGCELEDGSAGGMPVWWSDDAGIWHRADAPSVVPGCVTQVVASPFGFYAQSRGAGDLLHSTDGETWQNVELFADFGFEYAGQLGVVMAIFVSPDHDRVTLLYSAASEAESRVATLVTTTDGTSWEPGPADSAALFDSSDVAAVIEGGDGLLAVGASPGGEFVPTAAVFTSPDGLDWRRVTGDGPDFVDKVMTDVMSLGDGYVAVGGDFFETGLMTAWTSPDGLAWTRSPHPPEQTDPDVAHMTARALTRAGGLIWASGIDFDARRSDDGLAALWSSRDGVEWSRVDLDEFRARVPFVVIQTPDLNIGTWPPPFSPAGNTVAIFGAD